MSCTFGYITKQLRETMKHDGKTVLEINIKYPCFSSIDDGECLSEATLKSINSFYETLANNFYTYASTKRFDAAKAALSADNVNHINPYGEAINTIVLQTGQYISVICDITRYDGVFARHLRISQVWDTKNGEILPLRAFISGKASLPVIKKKLAGQLEKELTGEPDHDYYATCRKAIYRHFNKDSFFLTDRGLVIYYQSGILCPQNEGTVCFTLPWEETEFLHR